MGRDVLKPHQQTSRSRDDGSQAAGVLRNDLFSPSTLAWLMSAPPLPGGWPSWQIVRLLDVLMDGPRRNFDVGGPSGVGTGKRPPRSRSD
jgi:hypothetical protein